MSLLNMHMTRVCCALKFSIYIPQTIGDNFISNFMFCDVVHFIANLIPLWDLDCDSADTLDNKSALVQAMAWCRTGDTPSPETISKWHTECMQSHCGCEIIPGKYFAKGFNSLALVICTGRCPPF